jgi:Uma2 family endonuclease
MDGREVGMVSSALHGNPGRYTVADWEEIEHNPDGPRVELISGEFSVTPPPSGQHQYVGDMLRMALYHALREAGRDDLYVVTAIGVELDTSNGFIPDIAVLNTRPFATMFHAGQVVLAVEIVSPSTTKQDRMVKPAAYASAGVPFFWLVESVRTGAPTIVTHRLANRGYVEDVTLTPGTTTVVTAASPVPVKLDPADLLPH